MVAVECRDVRCGGRSAAFTSSRIIGAGARELEELMHSTTVAITTGRDRRIVDLTPILAEFVAGRGDGLLSVFVPHATAGLAMIELGAGTDTDLMTTIDGLLPRDDTRYRHRHGSPGHGGDHVLPAFISPSLTIPVIDGRMTLGTWQSVALVDPNEDNPNRTLRMSFLSSSS
jgi:secondary thiamine-phosphate synthase enzyme